MLAFLLACGPAPQPGEPGYEACEPYVPTDDVDDDGCLVWSCYRVISRENVEWWYETADRTRFEPTYEGLRAVVYDQCGTLLPEADTGV